MLRYLGWILAFLAVLAGAWFGRKVPFSEQWPMYEGLRTTAAIIFGVIGAWLAIIYPERLKLSFKSGKKGVPTETGVGQLFSPVVNSTLVLGSILVVGVIAPILKQFPPPINIEMCRGLSYGFLVALTLLQLWTVLLTLVPADTIKSYVDHEDETKRVLDGLTVLSRKKGP